MRLLNSKDTYVVTETSFGGTTRAGEVRSGATVPVWDIKRIVAWGVSSVNPNSSGGIKVRFGRSSGAIESTLVVLPSPTSVGLFVDIPLDVKAGWFDAFTNEAGQYGLFVYGN